MIADAVWPRLRMNRNGITRCSRRSRSLVGEWCARWGRSSRCSPDRYLDIHFEAVAGETWNRSAALVMGHRPPTVREARRYLPIGVRGALA